MAKGRRQMISRSQNIAQVVSVLSVGLVLANAPTGHADVLTSVTTNLTTFNVGTVTAQDNMLLNATNGGAQFIQLSSGGVQIGGATGAAGGSGNTVIISNALLTSTLSNFVGVGSINNTLTLLSNTVWNMGNTSLRIGAMQGGGGATQASNNVVNVLGGAVLSNGIVYVGITNSAGPVKYGAANSFIVSNGGYAELKGLYVGNVLANAGFNGYSNNVAYVSNVTVVAGTRVSTGGIGVGNGVGVSNRIVLANVMWNGNAGTMDVGSGRSTVGSTLQNSLTVKDGSILTNFGTITVGNAQFANTGTNQANSLIVTGPNTLLQTVNGLVIVGAGTSGGVNRGEGGALSNSMQVLAGATVLSTNLRVGYVFGVTGTNSLGTANSVLVNSATWTNRGDTHIGWAIANNNFAAQRTSTSNNILVVADGGTFWTTNVVMGLVQGGLGTALSGNNQIVISNGASLFTKDLTVGVVVQLGAATLNSSGNSVLVTNGGLLEVGGAMTVSLLGGTGNTISNRNGIYQFTSTAPVITPNGFGNIAITDGTISFRGINNADVTSSTNGGSTLANIKFAGNNTFMLNGASNTAAAANQTYTFQTSATPSNYVNLAMVNGQTAYGNGNLTIGSGGSLLASNTTAAVLGSVFTNSGTVRVAAGSLLISGEVSGGGVYAAVAGGAGSTLTFGGGGSLSTLLNTGATVRVESTLTNGSFFVNNGTLLVGNNGTYRSTANVTNAATRLIANISGDNGTLDTPLVNQGIVEATNGTLQLLGAASGAGTYRAVVGAGPATLTFGGGGTISALFNTGATIRVENSGIILTNAASRFINAGTLAVVGGGTYVNMGGLQNNSSGIITSSNARLVVNGSFTNQAGATLTMLNSVGTFNGISVNQGAWITDPTTNIFNGSHTETASGYISAAAGDVFIFKSNLVNQSTQNTDWDTFNTTPGGAGSGGTKFIFDGTNTVSSTGYTQQFHTAGVVLTGGFIGTPITATTTQQVSSFGAVSGFITNFALDRLEIGNLGTNSILQLSDSFLGTPNGALFVNDLWIFGSSRLILSNNTRLYFVNSNNWSSANYTLAAGAELHQLVLPSDLVTVVPEPSVLLMWFCGGLTVYWSRRRRSRAGTQ